MPERPSSNKVLLALSLFGVSLLGGDHKTKHESDEPERMMASLEVRDYIAATISNDQFSS